MAGRDRPLLADPPAEPVTHRIRVGLTGLAFVFLLVMLATAFLGAGRDPAGPAAAAQNATEPSEPLAQLGVVPGNPAPVEPSRPSQPAGAARR